MTLVALNASRDGFQVDLKYASCDNITGQKIYKNATPYLHKDAFNAFLDAHKLAQAMGLNIKIFDAFRPTAAQEILWSYFPDPNFVAPPAIGSPHTRGIAIDLTLIDQSGKELDMGTYFDDFTDASYHKSMAVSAEAQKNRILLCGLMRLAGWNHNTIEWWHYQLPEHKTYPLINDELVCREIMT